MMSNLLMMVLAVVCFLLAIFLFFKNTYNVLLNTLIRRYWSQAEKCYVNFESMFMDEKFTLPRCKIIILVSMVTWAVVVAFLTRNAPSYIPLVAIVIAMFVGWVFPGLLTSYLHKRYVGKFDDQLIDALGMLGSGLRSGLSLQQALGLVAAEMPNPTSQEFQLVLNEYNYGKTLDEAFERFALRVPSVDLGIAVESVLILRSTGGNLVEVFEIINDTIRERKKIEGKIKSMTAMGVFQGVLIGAMPFILMFFLKVLNPEYMQPLFNTILGWVLIGFTVLLVAIGGFAIKKIITIDV